MNQMPTPDWRERKKEEKRSDWDGGCDEGAGKMMPHTCNVQHVDIEEGGGFTVKWWSGPARGE